MTKKQKFDTEKRFFLDCLAFYRNETSIHALRSNMTGYGIPSGKAIYLDDLARMAA